MRRPLPFWIAVVLGLIDMGIKTAIMGGLVPLSPPIYLGASMFVMSMILWVNSIFINPLRIATPTGTVVPVPAPLPGEALPATQIALVADLPAGTTAVAVVPEPPKGAA